MTIIEHLKAERAKYQALSAGWNGEDTTFSHEGKVYDEFQAREASDIVDQIDSLVAMISNLDF